MATVLVIYISLSIFLKPCTAEGYYVFKPYFKEYKEAENDCNDEGRYLTSIESSSQNQEITELCQVL